MVFTSGVGGLGQHEKDMELIKHDRKYLGTGQDARRMSRLSVRNGDEDDTGEDPAGRRDLSCLVHSMHIDIDIVIRMMRMNISNTQQFTPIGSLAEAGSHARGEGRS